MFAVLSKSITPPQSWLLPVTLVFSLATAVQLLSGAIGLSFTRDVTLAILGLSGLLLGVSLYAHCRQAAVLAETAMYAGLWTLNSFTCAKLTYLAIFAGFPLRDVWFTASDHALGFHWMRLAAFLASHPWLRQAQLWAYASHEWQPVLTIPLLAWLCPERNREFLMNMITALLLTSVTVLFLPAIGPADSGGWLTSQGEIIHHLRAGEVHGLPLNGIVSFPSFHTGMAILFTIAHRGMRTFIPVALLNLAMLISIPYCGYHYLTDMFGGAMIAALTLWLNRKFVSEDIISQAKQPMADVAR